MSETVVVRLSGPLMAWPSADKFGVRRTEPSPTFSAMLGMLASAAGVPRDVALPPFLTEVHMVARVDEPGSVIRDFHTVNPRSERHYRWLPPKDLRQALPMVTSADGSPRRDPVVTERFYRSGATVVLFVADPTGQILTAVRNPKWAVFGGRKSCVLSFPFLLGVTSAAPLEAAALVPSASTRASMDVVSFADGGPLVRSDGISGSFAAPHSLLASSISRVSPPRASDWLDVAAGLGS